MSRLGGAVNKLTAILGLETETETGTRGITIGKPTAENKQEVNSSSIKRIHR